MKIVNPLYDRVFKYLMDNESIAKKILSVIIDCEILSLESKPQETAVLIKGTQIFLPRYDFKAIILTQTGERFATLIEVQKSRTPNPVARFREYLGQNYSKKHTYINQNGKSKTEHLPIISIYILGYNLGKNNEYKTPGIIIKNQVVDAITKKVIEKKHDFVKLLTHPTYILQVERLKGERKTRLEKMLNLFDQTHRTDDKYILELTDIDDEFAGVASYLNKPMLNEKFIRSLKYEQDYEKGIQEERKLKEEALIREKEAQEREKKAQEREKEAHEREKKERRLKEEERRLKEDANNSLKKIILMMLENNKTILEIANILDKDEKEIKKILE